MTFYSHPLFFIPIKFETIEIKPHFNGVIKTSQCVPCCEIHSSGFENQNMECLDFYSSLGELVKISVNGSWLDPLNNMSQWEFVARVLNNWTRMTSQGAVLMFVMNCSPQQTLYSWPQTIERCKAYKIINNIMWFFKPGVAKLRSDINIIVPYPKI